MTADMAHHGERRRALAAFVGTAVAGLAGALGAVLGAFAAPVRREAGKGWLRAAGLSDLEPGTPFAASVSVAIDDGWRRTRVPQTVFLVWDGAGGIRAMSATCTHLGCRVAWDAATKRLRCPCHGGVYDAEGRVTGGPPPSPLASVEARIVSDAASQDEVLVRL